MEKEVLGTLEGVSSYYIISLIMFFAMFVTVLIWAFKADKSYLKKMGDLPLENNNANE
jgi:cytochrome c oxidase cbb3-type subunit IV